MTLTAEQEQEFEFRARLEAEQAQAQAQAPAPVADPAIEEYNELSAPRRALKQVLNVTSGATKALTTDVLDAGAGLYNLGAAGLNKLGLIDEQPQATPILDKVPGYKTTKDILTARSVPRGASPVADFSRAAVEWGAGALNPLNTTKKIDMAMGAMAGAGELVAGETGQMAGLLPVAGGIVNALRGKTTGAPKDVQQAVDFLDDVLADTPTAQTTLNKRLAAGEKGTLADLTSSPTAYNVENTLAPAGSSVAREVQAVTDEADAALRGTVGDVLPDVALDTSVSAAADRVEAVQAKIAGKSRSRQAALDTATTARADTAIAQEAADTATIADAQATAAALRGQSSTAQGLYTGVLPHEASTALHGTTIAHKKALKDKAKGPWKEFDDSPPVDVSELMDGLEAHIDELNIPKRKEELLRTAFGKDIDDLIGMGAAPVKPNEIQAVLVDIKDKISSRAAKNESTQADKIMGNIVRTLEQELIKHPSTAKLGEAIAATKRVYTEAVPEKIKKTLVSPNVETYAKRIGFAGEEGANTARLASESNNPATVKDNDAYIRASGGQEGLDEKFMSKYAGYLSRRPALKAELQDIVNMDTAATVAEKTSKTTEKTLTKAVKASETARATDAKVLVKAGQAVKDAAAKNITRAQKGLIGDYSRTPDGTVEKLLNGKGTKDLKTLMTWAKNNNVGASFKANVRDKLVAKLFPAKGGKPQVTGKSIDEFNKVKQSLVDSGVMTVEDVATIDAALAKTSRADARKASGKMIVDPKVTPAEKIKATAGALAIVSTTGMPHALLATRLVRDGIENVIKSRKLTSGARAKLDEFIVNPEKYAEAYKMLQEYEQGGKALTAVNTDRMLRAVIGVGQATAQENR